MATSEEQQPAGQYPPKWGSEAWRLEQQAQLSLLRYVFLHSDAARRWRKELRGLLSLLIFIIGVSAIFQSWELSLMLTAVLGIHEVGHALAVSQFQIDWQIGFGPAGAWTITPLKQRKALGNYSNSLIHLAGPLFNIVYAVLALLLFVFLAQPGQDFWLRLANLSALIALINLLPIGDLTDGGKFVKMLFSSLGEPVERWILVAMILFPISLFLILFFTRELIGELGLMLRAVAIAVIGVWYLVDMVVEGTRDEPQDAVLPQSMTRLQSNLLLATMVFLMLVSTGILMITPFWLTQDHVVAMVEGLARNLITAYVMGWNSILALLVVLAVLLIYKYKRTIWRRLTGSSGV